MDVMIRFGFKSLFLSAVWIEIGFKSDSHTVAQIGVVMCPCPSDGYGLGKGGDIRTRVIGGRSDAA